MINQISPNNSISSKGWGALKIKREALTYLPQIRKRAMQGIAPDKVADYFEIIVDNKKTDFVEVLFVNGPVLNLFSNMITGKNWEASIKMRNKIFDNAILKFMTEVNKYLSHIELPSRGLDRQKGIDHAANVFRAQLKNSDDIALPKSIGLILSKAKNDLSANKYTVLI
jgi:hypothetical protein